MAAEVGANPGLKIGSLVAGMVAGADTIDVTGSGGRARCRVVAEELDVLAEADLALLDEWAVQLNALAELIGSRFPAGVARDRALAYVKGLLSPVVTRNRWTLANGRRGFLRRVE